MIASLIFYLVLTAVCWAFLWPMLFRDPRPAPVRAAGPLYPDVPVVTFDSRGLV